METAMQSIPDNRLAHFPITFFGVTMGVFGLAVAMRAGGFEAMSQVVTGAGTLVFVVLLGFYIAKAVRFPAAVAVEWNHPVRLCFFPAANISLLLLSLLLQKIAPDVSAVFWMIGAATQAILTVVIVSTWISHRVFGPAILSPAWFIPAVANVIVPIGGAHLGYVQVSWYFFAVGLLFWLILVSLVFNRLIFHDPLPGKLRPTMVILIAPPSLAFVAWIGMTGGQLDAAAQILINLGIFFAAVVAVQMPALLRLPFAMSFWALSFPLAALTTALFRFSAISGSHVHYIAALAMLVLLAGVIVVLGARTVRATVAGQVCVPE